MVRLTVSTLLQKSVTPTNEAIAVVLVFNGSNADIAATFGQACRDGLERQLNALNRGRH
jgi:hypothetical protein